MGQIALTTKIDQKRLSIVQEQYLVDRITELATLKNLPSHNQVREMTIKIPQIQGDNTPCGILCIGDFLNEIHRYRK